MVKWGMRGSAAAHSLNAQALMGHDAEGRVLGDHRCVLCSPDEAVGAVEDRATSVGGGGGGKRFLGCRLSLRPEVGVVLGDGMIFCGRGLTLGVGQEFVRT